MLQYDKDKMFEISFARLITEYILALKKYNNTSKSIEAREKAKFEFLAAEESLINRLEETGFKESLKKEFGTIREVKLGYLYYSPTLEVYVTNPKFIDDSDFMTEVKYKLKEIDEQFERFNIQIY